ncbi:hypothetical protein PM082_014792 [Marasmius tenuissimus]|nr:hypothetical protein PM082_014792 [Marasmius tenuissimus]
MTSLANVQKPADVTAREVSELYRVRFLHNFSCKPCKTHIVKLEKTGTLHGLSRNVGMEEERGGRGARETSLYM